ncbi:hypothetical protein BJI69_10570 [Luteibacter rhizovicinus DSM 16549]|uniref:Uncharacterized protein n=1 Tax=Luteibacter rhizovicinus DSM 16549 TaxID=1440763 RepID=A0A0G9H9Z6_9GAMM|nr:hypothetical protein [Luteibacter rhizovicinus]APG04295.1 hypothetical protein BJI69_10570 [Luteibacter rhizovicinus DSM 16549]KLD66074.1 hypothetical protein Y883_15085 [Luteibacter rhizovicinus DSM 16549]KLD78772.1 hypothetical protein Y886_08335 [Xanthomonas hyacinthi DSM 19077]
MVVFDIPFHPPQDTWTIALPSGAQHAFSARHEAVRFAAREASRLTTSKGRQVFLSIEGEDGKWRLFGPDLKSPDV